MTPEDDTALVARCRQGDAAAWSELVRSYQRLVYTIVLRAGLDEHGAADIFQTVFTRLLQHLPRIQQPERLKAWIVTTTKREALQQRRRGLRTVSMSADEGSDTPAWDMADDALLPEEVLSELQQQDALRTALEKLDARCQQLLKLLFRDDDERLGYDEIASRMGMPLGSIGPSRARCLDKLRRTCHDPRHEE